MRWYCDYVGVASAADDPFPAVETGDGDGGGGGWRVMAAAGHLRRREVGAICEIECACTGGGDICDCLAHAGVGHAGLGRGFASHSSWLGWDGDGASIYLL